MTQEENIFNEMGYNYLVGFTRGSVHYGTFKPCVSDVDYLIVVDDKYDDFLSQFPNGIAQNTGTEKVSYNEGYSWFDEVEDREYTSESGFLKMIDDNDIVALEAIFLPDGPAFGLTSKLKEYRERFKLDKWKLRENVSHICSNSWVKCKKKLTVEKDYNLRIAQKSLFHSLRIYMFGIQIAEQGKIVDYQCAKDLWKEIENVENPTWEYYKEKYQPMFNSLRSKLVELCPKPEEKFKDKKVANVDEK